MSSSVNSTFEFKIVGSEKSNFSKIVNHLNSCLIGTAKDTTKNDDINITVDNLSEILRQFESNWSILYRYDDSFKERVRNKYSLYKGLKIVPEKTFLHLISLATLEVYIKTFSSKGDKNKFYRVEKVTELFTEHLERLEKEEKDFELEKMDLGNFLSSNKLKTWNDTLADRSEALVNSLIKIETHRKNDPTNFQSFNLVDISSQKIKLEKIIKLLENTPSRNKISISYNTLREILALLANNWNEFTFTFKFKNFYHIEDSDLINYLNILVLFENCCRNSTQTSFLIEDLANLFYLHLDFLITKYKLNFDRPYSGLDLAAKANSPALLHALLSLTEGQRGPEPIEDLLFSQNWKEFIFRTPFNYRTIQECTDQCIDILMMYGADVNYLHLNPHMKSEEDAYDQETVVCIAASLGNDDIVRTLVNANADINYVKFGLMPLQSVAKRGILFSEEKMKLTTLSTAKLIVELGGDLFQNTFKGESCVKMAEDCDNFEIAEYLEESRKAFIERTYQTLNSFLQPVLTNIVLEYLTGLEFQNAPRRGLMKTDLKRKMDVLE